jgi:hypothetical protein
LTRHIARLALAFGRVANPSARAVIHFSTKTEARGVPSSSCPEERRCRMKANGHSFNITEVNAYLLRMPHSSVFEGCGF